MHRFFSLAFVLNVFVLNIGFLVFSSSSIAQSSLPLPGCETAPAVRKILDEKLDSKILEQLKLPERIALERKVLEDLIARYPRELEPCSMALPSHKTGCSTRMECGDGSRSATAAAAMPISRRKC